jgi:hypothetical protein
MSLAKESGDLQQPSDGIATCARMANGRQKPVVLGRREGLAIAKTVPG